MTHLITNKSSLLLQTVDIGLGSVDKNAADVFHRLQNVTKDAGRINTFANMNASVHVLVRLSQKLQNINNESAVAVSITESLITFVECYNPYGFHEIKPNF